MKPVYGNRVALFFTIGFVLASNSFAQVSQGELTSLPLLAFVDHRAHTLENPLVGGCRSDVLANRVRLRHLRTDPLFERDEIRTRDRRCIAVASSAGHTD